MSSSSSICNINLDQADLKRLEELDPNLNDGFRTFCRISAPIRIIYTNQLSEKVEDVQDLTFQILVRQLKAITQQAGPQLEAVQIYLTSQQDLHFNFLSNISQQTFESIKSKNSLNIKFNDFPNVLASLISNSTRRQNKQHRINWCQIYHMRGLVKCRCSKEQNIKIYNCLSYLLTAPQFRKLINQQSLGLIIISQNWRCFRVQSTQYMRYWLKRILLYCSIFRLMLASINDIEKPFSSLFDMKSMFLCYSQYMSIYLSFLDSQKYAQQLIETPSFQAKHKISINNPVKTHYTVQGVQSYAPEQLKALKQRQDRTMLGKQGTYVPLKVVLLSDQVIDFDQRDPNIPSKRQEIKMQQKAKSKVKERPQSAKPQRSRLNPRNALSTNNQAIVKLEKEVAKRNSLQRKLQKMSQKYKEYFKDVDLKEGLKIRKKKQQEEQQYDNKIEQDGKDEYSEENDGNELEQSKKTEKENKFDRNSASTRPFSSKDQQKSSKKAKNQSKILESQIQNTIRQSNMQSDDEGNRSKNFSLNLGYDLIAKSTTFSEKLGSAIHQMFK